LNYFLRPLIFFWASQLPSILRVATVLRWGDANSLSQIILSNWEGELRSKTLFGPYLAMLKFAVDDFPSVLGLDYGRTFDKSQIAQCQITWWCIAESNLPA
jgi:hypothetical protein